MNIEDFGKYGEVFNMWVLVVIDGRKVREEEEVMW